MLTFGSRGNPGPQTPEDVKSLLLGPADQKPTMTLEALSVEMLKARSWPQLAALVTFDQMREAIFDMLTRIQALEATKEKSP